MTKPYDIDDIEAFIKGLKDTFDTLDKANPKDLKDSHGLQLNLAKAISLLRHKKIALIEPQFDPNAPTTKEEMKNFLIKELENLKNLLDSDDNKDKSSRKFNLALKIANLREKIKNL
jgi:hypothetical protein